MSKKANPTLIGTFVVGAIILVIAAILIFGSGEFFQEKTEYVMFFDESVKGLMVGAPVSFQGVQIGSVTEVRLEYDPGKLITRIPVFAEFTRDSITYIGQSDTKPQENMKRLIEQGLRAQLKSQSMLTGQLYIQLDFHPDKPIKLVGSVTKCPEIPTIPSSIEELKRTIEDLPIRELMDSANHMIQTIDELVSSPELKGTIVALNQTAVDARNLVNNLDALVQDVQTHVDPLATGLEGTIGDTRKLVQNIDSKVDPVAANLEDTLTEARAALQRAEQALANIEGLTEEDSTVVYELLDALDEIAKMARSLRVAAEFIEQHPESLVRGKARGE